MKPVKLDLFIVEVFSFVVMMVIVSEPNLSSSVCHMLVCNIKLETRTSYIHTTRSKWIQFESLFSLMWQISDVFRAVWTQKTRSFHKQLVTFVWGPRLIYIRYEAIKREWAICQYRWVWNMDCAHIICKIWKKIIRARDRYTSRYRSFCWWTDYCRATFTAFIMLESNYC